MSLGFHWKVHSNLCVHFKIVFKILHFLACFSHFWGIFLYTNIRLIHFIFLLYIHILIGIVCHFKSVCFPEEGMLWCTVSAAAAYLIIPLWHTTAVRGKSSQMHANSMMQWLFYRLSSVFCYDFHMKIK